MAQRVSQPVFDAIVVVEKKNSWVVIPDVAKAVDSVLSGTNFDAHVRSRDPETGEMFYEFAREVLESRQKDRDR